MRKRICAVLACVALEAACLVGGGLPGCAANVAEPAETEEKLIPTWVVQALNLLRNGTVVSGGVERLLQLLGVPGAHISPRHQQFIEHAIYSARNRIKLRNRDEQTRLLERIRTIANSGKPSLSTLLAIQQYMEEQGLLDQSARDAFAFARQELGGGSGGGGPTFISFAAGDDDCTPYKDDNEDHRQLVRDHVQNMMGGKVTVQRSLSGGSVSFDPDASRSITIEPVASDPAKLVIQKWQGNAVDLRGTINDQPLCVRIGGASGWITVGTSTGITAGKELVTQFGKWLSGLPKGQTVYPTQ